MSDEALRLQKTADELHELEEEHNKSVDRIAELEKALAEADSFRINYEHATKIEREEHQRELAEAQREAQRWKTNHDIALGNWEDRERRLAKAQQALNDLEINLNCSTFAMPTNNEPTAEDRIDWLCEQIHKAQQARERAAIERDIAKNNALTIMQMKEISDEWQAKAEAERDTLLGLLRDLALPAILELRNSIAGFQKQLGKVPGGFSTIMTGPERRAATAIEDADSIMERITAALPKEPR